MWWEIVRTSVFTVKQEARFLRVRLGEEMWQLERGEALEQLVREGRGTEEELDDTAHSHSLGSIKGSPETPRPEFKVKSVRGWWLSSTTLSHTSVSTDFTRAGVCQEGTRDLLMCGLNSMEGKLGKKKLMSFLKEK